MARHAMAAPLSALLFGILAGCVSAPVEQATLAPAPPMVAPETWQLVNKDIWTSSRTAADEAEGYARASLSDWMEQVRRRTDEVFVPWYTSFGTQQWLAIKASFYGINSPERRDEATQRLAEYLQEQYYEQVLEPVSERIDPQRIREQAAALYVRRLVADLRPLPERYFLPPEAFHRRLEQITAIHLDTVPPLRASLDRLLQAEDPTADAAYAALLKRVRPEGGDIGSEMPRERFYPVAGLDADALAGQLALRGGATAAALALGGVGGILVSIGVSGWQAMEHEKHKPALEAQLRSSLRPALDGMWDYLAGDSYGGIAAPVRHMHTQVENGILSAQIQSENG